MDPVTHAALGALAGVGVQRLHARKTHRLQKVTSMTPGQALWIGAGAGLFPDIDILTFLIDPLAYHALWHGTYTHSLLLAPLWAGLYAFGIYSLFHYFQRSKARELPAFGLLFMVSLLGILSHIGADLLTAWDVGIGYPLFDQRLSFGLLFVIDPIFTATLLFALWGIWRQRKHIVIPALIGAIAWIAFAHVQKENAQAIGDAALPEQTHIHAWPQPFSVFHWLLIQERDNGYAVAYVRTQANSPLQWPLHWMRQTATAYKPTDSLIWEVHLTTPHAQARSVWEHQEFAMVRAFMTYPIYWETDADGCVWFTDLLFVLPTQPPPFLYGGCWEDRQVRVERQHIAPPWSEH
ncbi:metal-dependent hydrolase [Aliidiomarina sanyensis]|uniref:Metal-dependent hydrolase n=1 Tax=Aliidiomarina sanyensis TaxID=1249555 RepID=A0A432WBN1_9GAMM|nr:metal-dependent hydrolase [Aliidiomarina sanyensis]RUO29491.1 hypothetical protein CWE11_09595 [Aliidiomarina sanyensis]